MIISQPEIQTRNNEVWVSAHVAFENMIDNIPSRLWFCFPEKYAPFISDRSDGFITSLFFLGMALGEDITVHGTVSPRLAYGLEECQRVYKVWFPHAFQPIKIHYAHLAEVPASETGKHTALAFSGGIDSTFTLLQHLPPQQLLPQYQISHCIFIHGFDIPLKHAEEYQHVAQNLCSVLASLKVELVECKTNLRAFMTERVSWSHAHGGGMIGIALLLSKLVRNFLVSSSWSLHKFEPWGSSVMTDPMLSTEQFETIYYGFPNSRMEKVEAVSQWKPAREFLRVCLNPHKAPTDFNCCHCEKCLRTMIFLDATDTLKYFKTFNRSLHILDYFRWIPGYVIHVPELTGYLVRRKKYHIIPLLVIPHIMIWSQHILRKCVPHTVKKWLKNMVYDAKKDPYSGNNVPPSFDTW